MNKTSLILCTILATLAPLNEAVSASSQWFDSGKNRLRLVVAEPAPGEAKVNGALVIDLAPGWKTYWKDPGDAGVPLDLTIDGSTNAANVTLAYPHPKRFDDGITKWAGYDEPVHIPFEFIRTDPAKAGQLKATVFLGICEKICIPVQTTFQVPFGEVSASSIDAFVVQQARAQLPKPATEGNGVSAIRRSGDELLISTEMQENSARELFLAAPKGWQFAAPVVSRSEGGKTEFTARILFKPEAAHNAPVPVDYSMSNGTNTVSGTTSFSGQ